MMRAIIFAIFLLVPSVANALCNTPPCVLVSGASGLTGVPRSGLDGNALAWGYDLGIAQRFAQRIGATVGGTAAGGSPYPDYCTDAGGPPHSTCPAGWPACNTTGNKPLCDLACATSFMNSASGDHCRPICNVSGGSCQAGSQVAYIAAEIAAAGANEIAAVILNFSSNDMTLACISFDAGSTTNWDNWLAGITASISDIRDAIDASSSPNAEILILPEALYFHSDDSADEYWGYNANTLVDCWLAATGSNWGGPLQQYMAYLRTEAATYDAILVDYVFDFLVPHYDRYSEKTYLTTDTADCTGTNSLNSCTNGHLNHFGKRDIGNYMAVLYAKAKAQTDTDGDGIVDSLESVYGTNSSLADTDGDGCNDGVEIGGAYVFGGRGDPTNGYDFFDVNGDKVIDDKDSNAMRQRVVLGIPDKAFNSTFQRLPAVSYSIGDDPAGKNEWNTRQVTAGSAYPNDRPSIQDWQLLELQRTRKCNCSYDYSDCRLAVGAECQTDNQCLSGTCGCDGAALRRRICLTADTATGGYTTDPRKCTNLEQFQRCLENSDCSSNVCSDIVNTGVKACVGN